MALPIEKPRTFLSPGYQDNLGWGFGTALGAKAAMPDRKVLAIAGDGGFMYQVGELATAVRHNLAVVVVVFDNGGFGNVKRIQQQHYGNRLIASDLANPDFGKLADSFGVASFKALDARQLEDCLQQGLRPQRAGPGLGAARRRAEPMGHDHDAQGARLSSCRTAGLQARSCSCSPGPRASRALMIMRRARRARSGRI